MIFELTSQIIKIKPSEHIGKPPRPFIESSQETLQDSILIVCEHRIQITEVETTKRIDQMFSV
jgi:hypothetical protein